MLQHAARQRTDAHNIQRMKDLPASTILQDVAVKGSNVAGEHVPEHALNLRAPIGFETRNANPE
jgi:hypothetical protein